MDEPVTPRFVARLAALREATGVDEAALATALGVETCEVEAQLSGRNRLDPSALDALAQLFERHVSALITDTEYADDGNSTPPAEAYAQFVDRLMRSTERNTALNVAICQAKDEIDRLRHENHERERSAHRSLGGSRRARTDHEAGHS